MRFSLPAAAMALAACLLAGLAASAAAVELQGHRGARGLAPENTLAGFAAALAIGVDTLELDVVMSADGVLMVSHDPVLNPSLVRDADGRWLTPPGPAVWSLDTGALARFDVGRIDPESRYAGRFPDQRAVDGERIPTLAQVLDLLEADGAERVRLNVETKLSPLEPEVSPAPARFARALVTLLEDRGFVSRASVQSFDWRTLVAVQAMAPAMKTVYLSAQQRWLDNIRAGEPGASPWTAGLDVDDYQGSVPALVAAAGGRIWSPYFRDLDAAALARAHALGLAVVVWTVNEASDMHRLLEMGVDGLITDFPDRAREVFAARGLPLAPPVTVAR